MDENNISRLIVDACYQIHVKLGPGLLESVYEEILFFELTAKGLRIERQKALPVIWKDVKLDFFNRLNC